MNNDFVMTHQEWIPSGFGPNEIRQTSANLKITLANHVITRVDNEWEHVVRDTVTVATYPLALWFAASWWRLRWEPTPKNIKDNTPWRMAHEMSAAGYGYLWPTMQFESDGELIHITAGSPYEDHSSLPICYLQSCKTAIPVALFEDSVVSFIQEVLARLDSVGIMQSELHALWQEVQKERDDPLLANYRKLEAMLGYEPDEAPEASVEEMQRLSEKVGAEAGAEMAAACALQEKDPSAWLKNIDEMTQHVAIAGSLEQASSLMAKFTPAKDVWPWLRGYQTANNVRRALDLGDQPLSNEKLGAMLGMKTQQFLQELTYDAGLSLVVRHNDSHKARFLFRKKWETGRRFEAGRLLADAILCQNADQWLPATETTTARQKMQRAFAAQLLAPVEAVQSFMDHDHSDDRYEEAAKYFNVSPFVIKDQCQNYTG